MGIAAIVPKVLGYGKRIAKVMPEAILGNGAEVAGAAMRSAKGSVLTRGKAGFKALEADIAAKKALHGNFFKRITANLGDIPKLAKEGYNAAKAAGKNSILGGLKGLGKGLGKNMPFIAALPTVLMELPNIFTTIKEQGFGEGVKEIAKTGTRLAGGALGATIGSAICPVIGTAIGWMAGEWLTSKVVGKSYTQKKEEAQAIAQAQAEQAAQQAQQTTFTGNPYGTNPYGYDPYGMTNPMYSYNAFGNPYSDDIMMQGMNFNTVA